MLQFAGDDLISMDADGPRMAQAVAAQLRETGDWLEVVAGIDSVVVQFDLATTDRDRAEAECRLQMQHVTEPADNASQVVEIPISYGGEGGPDLADVCASMGLSEKEFVALHTAGEHRVDMLGFAPGFAYVSGLDEYLDIPRLKNPRVRVPRGSVGIAGGRTGLYSLRGPGGWPLIGRTRFVLFDPGQQEPFVLSPGMVLRFTDATEQ